MRQVYLKMRMLYGTDFQIIHLSLLYIFNTYSIYKGLYNFLVLELSLFLAISNCDDDALFKCTKNNIVL
jgi:hypothetical protein